MLTRLRHAKEISPARAIAGLVARFSQVATVCVAILGVTGIYQALVEVADWTNLIDTWYGLTLLFKLILLVPLLGFAALNLLLVKRRLAQAIVAPDEEKAIQPWYHVVRQSVSSEIIFVTIALVVTGALTSLPPGRDAFGSGLIARGEAADLRIILVTDPGQPGMNTFNIYLRNGIGLPVANAEKVALIFTAVEHEMGKTEAVADNVGTGHYVAQGGYVSMYATWRAEVLVRRLGQDDVRATLTLPMGPITDQSNSGLSLGYLLRFFLGLDIILGGIIVLYRAQRLSRVRRWIGRIAAISGLLVLGLGFATIVNTLISTAYSTGAQRDQVVVDPALLSRGKQIYQANCASCHGDSGRGDGPSGVTLKPPPANLQVHLQAGNHSDRQIFEWISKGISDTAMPAFNDRLTPTEIGYVLNYILTFAQ